MYGRRVILGADSHLRLKDTGVKAGSAFNTLQCANYLLQVNVPSSEV